MPAWPRALFAIALVVSLLVAGVAPLGAHPPGESAGTGPSAAGTGQITSVAEPDLAVDTTYRIDVQSGGDARWTVNRTFRFDDESDRAGFEELAEQFADGAGPERTVSAFEGASELASETTGRSMVITNVTRSTRVGTDSGSLVLSFRWTNFSRQEDGRIHVGDVFRTEPRWLSNISDGERLIITRPDGYQFYNVSTNVQNRVLLWNGPHTFGTGRPYAVFDPISSPPPSQDTTTVQSGDTPAGTALGAILALAVLAGVGYAVYTGRLDRPTESGSDTPISAEGDADTATTADSDEESAETPAADDGAGETVAATAGGAAAGGDDPDDDADEQATTDQPSDDGTDGDDVDEALLSDAERVERLLERNDGRMKQARIVEETGWSNAKVSQLLSSMAEEGQIEKLRIGRENLISFPEEGPDQ